MKRLAVLPALALVSAGMVSFAPSSASDPEQSRGTAIVVDPDDVLRPISHDLFGFNQRFENNGMLSYDPENDRIFPELLAAVDESGATVLRYPGGTTANPFHWKRAIGPQDERGCQLNGVTAAPAASTYGVDEHARFAEEIGATTNIVVNFDTGSPAEAADWVEYMNTPVGENPNGGTAWAQVRADNGHPEPYGVSWWEVGNEVTGRQTWLGALPSAERSEAYAFGGSVSYTNVGVGTECDQTASASRSAGTPGQQFVVRRGPITAGSQTVYVGGVPWTQVDELASAGPNDQVYMLDTAAGRISFGDGAHGAIPPSGSRISIDYVSGPHPGFVDFHQAMKAVDPEINVCWAAGNYRVLGNHPLDCAVNHRYSGGSSLGSAVDTHDWAMARAGTQGRAGVAAQQGLHRFRPNADLVLTEYGMFLGRDDPGPTPGFLRSLVQGLYMATELTYWIEAGAPLAQKHPLINPNPDDPPPGAVVFPSGNASPFGFYPDFVPQAAAHITNLFSHMIGTDQVAGTVVNGPIRKGDTAQYAALRTVASIDEHGRLSLIVVNRDPEQAVTAAVLPERFRYRSEAEVWAVTGDSVASYNSPEDPNVVRLTKDTMTVTEGGFEYTFPAHSVTAVRLTSAGVSVVDPVRIEAGGPISLERGQQTTTTVEITNTADPATSGPRRAAGELAVTGPQGWTVDIEPDVFALQPGQTRTATVTVAAPSDAESGSVIVAARQHGEITDIGIVDVNVTVPFEPVFSDNFDDAPVGQPPPGWTVIGPADGITVQPGSDGNVLVAQRTTPGTDRIEGIRPFAEISRDVRVRYRIRADQTDQGIALQLVDASGSPVLRFNVGGGGVFKYSDGSSVLSTGVGYTPGTWYDVDLILDADSGRYEAYVDGELVAEAARWPGGAPPAAVSVLIGPGNPRVAGYAIDDVRVSQES